MAGNVLDYRSRTAGERRERMRVHLVRTALALYAQHGFAGLAIDTVIKAADVSRGTFYNYFRASDELLSVVATVLSDELLAAVNPLLMQYEDPVQRVSVGVRLCLGVGLEYPQVAAFISRGGPLALEQSPLLREYLPRDLSDGMRVGRFTDMAPQLAFDLVVGPVLAAYHTMASGNVGEDYIANLAMGVLQSLGVARNTARRISHQTLPAMVMPEHSIILH